jgi:hypothetical protein
LEEVLEKALVEGWVLEMDAAWLGEALVES